MYNFDEITDRRHSGCVKWDSSPADDIIPMWVADMDFKTAPVIIEALGKRVEHGIFGYTRIGDDYYEAIDRWFSRQHGFSVRKEDVICVPGVVPAISAIIKGLVAPGDGVIIMTPVYNCFFSSIRNNGCKIVEVPLVRVDCGESQFTYSIDFGLLEEKASAGTVKMLLLCNPHNPAGRLWTKEELEKIADICRRNSVKIVSDEIHCELTRPGTSYVPFATIDPDAVVCVSPSKAFNTAGLQNAAIICSDKRDRDAIDRAVNDNEVCDVNPFGVEALKAAYSKEGKIWLDELREYIWGNYDYLLSVMRDEFPQCPVSLLEATYLPWIDVSSLGIPADRLQQRIMDEARVWVNSGVMYGKDGYIRLNIACPRAILVEGLSRLTEWFRNNQAGMQG